MGGGGVLLRMTVSVTLQTDNLASEFFKSVFPALDFRISIDTV